MCKFLRLEQSCSIPRHGETFSVNQGRSGWRDLLKSLPSFSSESLVSRTSCNKAWAEFFILLRGKGEAGAFVDGFLNLPLAGIIIGFHNTWSGIPLVLTLVGWALLIKGLIRFCAPKQALRMMARVSAS